MLYFYALMEIPLLPQLSNSFPNCFAIFLHRYFVSLISNKFYRKISIVGIFFSDDVSFCLVRLLSFYRTKLSKTFMIMIISYKK